MERYVSILDLWRLRLAGVGEVVGEVVQVTPLHPAEPSQHSAGGSDGPCSESLASDIAPLGDDELKLSSFTQERCDA